MFIFLIIERFVFLHIKICQSVFIHSMSNQYTKINKINYRTKEIFYITVFNVYYNHEI